MSAQKNDSANETPTQEPAGRPSRQTRGSSQTAQASAAVSNAVGVVRERLVAGEQIALVAAALIVAVWIIWDLIFDIGPGPLINIVGSFTLLIAVLMILAIWVHRWGQYDFGPGYRIILGALGVSLGLFAITDLLLTFRTDIDASASQWLGNLLFWIGGLAAVYGSWMVFRSRES